MELCQRGQNFSICNFLRSIFSNHKVLNQYKDKIDDRLKINKRTIPFVLGDEKVVNPFLVSKVTAYKNFMQINNFDELNFFKHLRSLKDNY